MSLHFVGKTLMCCCFFAHTQGDSLFLPSITVIRGSLVLAVLNAKQMVFFWATFYSTVKVNFRKWTKIKRNYYIILVIHSIFPHGDWKLWSYRQKVQCPISEGDFLAFTFVSPSIASHPMQLYLNMLSNKATKYGNMDRWVQYPLVYWPIKFLNVNLISRKHAWSKLASDWKKKSPRLSHTLAWKGKTILGCMAYKTTLHFFFYPEDSLHFLSNETSCNCGSYIMPWVATWDK